MFRAYLDQKHWHWKNGLNLPHDAEPKMPCGGLKDECVKNQSDLMLVVALDDNDALYWEEDTTKPLSPKRKQPQAEEESLDNSVSMVKMAMSVKKMPKSALKGSPSTNMKQKTQMQFTSDFQTVALQVTTILQLTKIVFTFGYVLHPFFIHVIEQYYRKLCRK